MGRKTPSLEDLSAVIAAIHDTALDSPDWTAALQRISSLFDSLNATVWMQDPSGGFLDIRMLPADESTRDYAEYYVHMDKLRPAVMGAPEGTILTNTMVIPRSEFVRTEFHADFADRHDMYDCMQARVLDGPGWSGFVAMTSTNRMGAFEHDDDSFGFVVGHVRRAPNPGRARPAPPPSFGGVVRCLSGE